MYKCYCDNLVKSLSLYTKILFNDCSLTGSKTDIDINFGAYHSYIRECLELYLTSSTTKINVFCAPW